MAYLNGVIYGTCSMRIPCPNDLIFGTFSNENAAADAVRALMSSGFDARYINALVRDERGVNGIPISVQSGMRRGVVLGGILGVVGGALIGAGSTMFAEGPILAVPIGAIGGGTFGVVQGGFFGMLLAKTKVAFGKLSSERSTILIGVNADVRSDLARRVLIAAGATEVGNQGGRYRGW